MGKRNSTQPTIIGSDDHAPFQHEARLDFYATVKRRYPKADFVHAGDLFDFHAMSRHQTEVDACSPEEEYEEARSFVKALTKIFPKGNIVLGNHDMIPQRQLASLGMPSVLLKNPNELYGLPKGWNVHPLYYVIEEKNTLVEHGIGSGGMYGCFRTALKKRGSFVQGHTHAHAMVKYAANHASTIFGMNVGCGCDDKALAMRYGKYHPDKGVLACGVVHSEKQAELILM